MNPARTSAFLSALSTEFAAMRRTVDDLAGVVSDHVQQTAPDARAAAMLQAQAVDALSQRLDALSGVTGALARGEPVVNALDGILLADLSGRLRQALLAADPVPQPVAGPAPGDLALFD